MIVNEFFENNAKKCDVREKKKGENRTFTRRLDGNIIALCTAVI